MARWFRTLCMALIVALAAASQPAGAMDMATAMPAGLSQCEQCPDDDGSEPCVVACLAAWPALAPALSVPVAVTSLAFACRRPDVLAGCAGPPEPQPPRVLARG